MGLDKQGRIKIQQRRDYSALPNVINVQVKLRKFMVKLCRIKCCIILRLLSPSPFVNPVMIVFIPRYILDIYAILDLFKLNKVCLSS